MSKNPGKQRPRESEERDREAVVVEREKKKERRCVLFRVKENNKTKWRHEKDGSALAVF